MQITLMDCTLYDALRELKYHQQKGRDCHFKGLGNGQVVLEVNYDKEKMLQV